MYSVDCRGSHQGSLQQGFPVSLWVTRLTRIIGALPVSVELYSFLSPLPFFHPACVATESHPSL